jgi:hypothetical protein
MTDTTKQAETITNVRDAFSDDEWAHLFPAKIYGANIGRQTNRLFRNFPSPNYSPSIEYIRADLVKPIQAEPVAYAVSSELQELQTDDSVCLYLTCESSERYDTPLYSADTVRALQLEAIRKTLEVTSSEAAELHKIGGITVLFTAEQIARIDPEEILSSLGEQK